MHCLTGQETKKLGGLCEFVWACSGEKREGRPRRVGLAVPLYVVCGTAETMGTVWPTHSERKRSIVANSAHYSISALYTLTLTQHCVSPSLPPAMASFCLNSSKTYTRFLLFLFFVFFFFSLSLSSCDNIDFNYSNDFIIDLFVCNPIVCVVWKQDGHN